MSVLFLLFVHYLISRDVLTSPSKEEFSPIFGVQ
uniref:Uncharacterized protein n=1 Tax=Lepeophtheirus salmonis TaxID=72036 RepID=A0A0K2ULH7_LEPSM